MPGQKYRYSLIALAIALTPVWSWAQTSGSEIKSAILGCQLEQTGCGDGLTIKIIKVYKNYAKASIAAANGSGETDIAYLEKKRTHWIVLDQGTGVDPEQLGIPRQAW